MVACLNSTSHVGGRGLASARRDIHGHLPISSASYIYIFPSYLYVTNLVSSTQEVLMNVWGMNEICIEFHNNYSFCLYRVQGGSQHELSLYIVQLCIFFCFQNEVNSFLLVEWWEYGWQNSYFLKAPFCTSNRHSYLSAILQIKLCEFPAI